MLAETAIFFKINSQKRCQPGIVQVY